MDKIVNLKKNNVYKEAKLGFSWTTLFFGFFVPLFRGDFKYMLIMLFLTPITGGLSLFFFPFTYNKDYVRDLLRDGYEPVSEKDEEILKNHNIIWKRPEIEEETE